MRHRRRMPMDWVAVMDVGKRRLGEAHEQRQSDRDYQQPFQDSQCMCPRLIRSN